MNPFDLRGPEFLFFFLFASAGALLVLRLVRWLLEVRASEPSLGDPYQLACLRGGPEETIRVAMVSLIDRGLLDVFGDLVKAGPEAGRNVARRPLDRALLEHFAKPCGADTALRSSSVRDCVVFIETELRKTNLLPDDMSRVMKAAAFGSAVLLIDGAALQKVSLAIERGHSNFGILVILAFAFPFVAWRLTFPRLTRGGEAALLHVRSLFAGLNGRAWTLRPGGSTAEIALLVAVFGLAALPREQFPWVLRLFPPPPPKPVLDASSWIGSSGDSSCSSSCGSSCGGGGGGGGGGCGGCGS